MHFDSAAAHAASNAGVADLVAVGRGRALVDLGRYAEAATSVAGVPVTFIYATRVSANVLPFYIIFFYNQLTTGDGKGGNGLNFVSARDPRVVTVPTGQTTIGTPDNYPAMYPFSSTAVPADSIALADGVEAGLITAEAALAAHDVGTWLATLNQLRADFTVARGPYPSDTSYHVLGPLTDPGTDSARVSLTFRERGFWLYGTGRRLGDLRRLVRQYGRDQSTVFPTGPYLNGTQSVLFTAYGQSVAFPVGTIESGNPKFHGCSSNAA